MRDGFTKLHLNVVALSIYVMLVFNIKIRHLEYYGIRFQFRVHDCIVCQVVDKYELPIIIHYIRLGIHRYILLRFNIVERRQKNPYF